MTTKETHGNPMEKKFITFGLVDGKYGFEMLPDLFTNDTKEQLSVEHVLNLIVILTKVAKALTLAAESVAKSEI